MKYLHNLHIRVFVKEEEDLEKIEQTLRSLFPFELEREKVLLEKTVATGFEDKKIVILEITLKKDRHLNAFLSSFMDHLSVEQKELLRRQKESRLDEDAQFFIRLEKTKLIEEQKYWITEGGNCFHIRMTLAAYPANREKELVLIEKIFK